MYLCAMDIDFASLYDFDILFWNCCDSVFFSCILTTITWNICIIFYIYMFEIARFKFLLKLISISIMTFSVRALKFG